MEIWQAVEGNRARGLKTELSQTGKDLRLACVLGWSHCWWKSSPVGATQVTLKGCPALTVPSVAFTSTSKSFISAEARETTREQISAPSPYRS